MACNYFPGLSRIFNPAEPDIEVSETVILTRIHSMIVSGITYDWHRLTQSVRCFVVSGVYALILFQGKSEIRHFTYISFGCVTVVAPNSAARMVWKFLELALLPANYTIQCRNALVL